MNFIAFPVGTTNIFPIANSSAGGQLLTEFNMRSRESIATSSKVKYFIGPSFTHSQDDFKVSTQRDNSGGDITISNTTIQIAPGRALVNGHYVESLAPINIDIDEANFLAAKENLAPLKGELAVGLRIAYSTYQTLAGSMEVEDANGEYYEGVQVVIVPASAVKLPEDVPGETQFNQVNMHLLLAKFTYRNGAIVGTVEQNEDKVKNVDAERISNINDLLDGTYLSKRNLDPNKLYTFAGKSDNGQDIDGRDTWCDSTDSLMVWDKSPRISTKKPSTEAKFVYDESDQSVVLVVPHKQVDGMVNTAGTPTYYQDKELALPAANFEENTGGVITAKYTKRIKDIEQKLNTFYRLPNGRMRQYIPVLTDREDLPKIPVSVDSKWPYSLSEFSLDLSEIKSRINKLETAIAKLPTEFESTLEGKVATYADSYLRSNFQSAVESVQQSISNVENKLSDLEERVAALESEGEESEDQTAQDIAELKTRMSNLDAAMTTLNESMGALTTTWTQYRNETSEYIHSSIGAAIGRIDSEIDLAKTYLKDYIDDQLYGPAPDRNGGIRGDLLRYIREQLDSRSVFTTWTWMPGDYVLVGEDQTVEASVDGRYPATMYIVGPGQVRSLIYVNDDQVTPISIKNGTDTKAYDRDYKTMLRKVPQQLAGGVEIASYELSSLQELSPNLWNLADYRGAPGIDYFVARYREVDEENQIETWTCFFYTPSLTDERYGYLDPIWITGGVPLATEQSVGGFVNVPDGAIGNGYVRMDEDGFLRLVDYELLLTGSLSSQFGQNWSEGSGLSLEELQGELDENVNDRIAFPNAEQVKNCEDSGEDPNVIHLHLYLPKDGEGVLNIHDLGSRYGTSVFVHIDGEATDAVTINFVNCDKLHIDSNISGAPNINLSRVNLYYDAATFDRIENIEKLSLWYERYADTDPDLQVDGMTVSLVGPIESTESIDPWDSTYANDNHYSYALRSITFGHDGGIINVGMLVSDSTTANIDEGKAIFVSPFVVPQGIGLNYPASRMTRRIKVTGSFVSAYLPQNGHGYMVKHTEFSALTQKWDTAHKRQEVEGTIAFYTDCITVTAISGIDVSGPNPDTIDCWDPNTPHYFVGGVID